MSLFIHLDSYESFTFQQRHLPVYKLFGSLDREHRHESAVNLPLREADYEIPEVAARVNQFISKFLQELNEGKLLLMLNPSERELKMAHQWVKSLSENGLIWVIGCDFSEDDLDRHRELGLRVLPGDSTDLFRALSLLAGD